MTLSADTMLELMAYADGELEGEALARVEALLASNDEARGVVLAVDDLGEWVREGEAARPADPSADGIAGAVMDRLARAPDARAEATVATATTATTGRDPSPFSVVSSAAGPAEMRELREAKAARAGRGRFVASAAGFLALAAGLLLVLRGTPSSPSRPMGTDHARATALGAQSVGEGPSIGPAPAGPREEAPSVVAEGDPARAATAGDGVDGVDVEQVESPSHQVSVFYLPAVAAATGGSNASSVVVWIGDDKSLGGL